MIRASVVFPDPGGPQKMSEGSGRAESTEERNFPSPRISSCPTNSESDLGRIRSARGARGDCAPGNSGYDCLGPVMGFLFSLRYIILTPHEVRRDHRQAYRPPGGKERFRALRLAHGAWPGS